MGIFSRWMNADHFDLTAEDLATCEGYVTADALRKLQEARAASRSDTTGLVFSFARLVASKIATTVAPTGSWAPVPSASAPVKTAPLAVAQPVGVSLTASSPPSAGSRPAPLASVVEDVRRDKAA